MHTSQIESTICSHIHRITQKLHFFHVFTQILLFRSLNFFNPSHTERTPTYTTYINLDITTDTINTLRVLWTLKVLINTHHLTSITTLHLNTSALASAQYTILNSTYMYWFFQFSWKYTFWAQKTSILDRQYEKHIFHYRTTFMLPAEKIRTFQLKNNFSFGKIYFIFQCLNLL